MKPIRIDLNDKEQRKEYSEFYKIHPLKIRHTIYYDLSLDRFSFLKLASKQTVRQDAVATQKGFKNTKKITSRYTCGLIAEVDFADQTEIDLTMRL